MSGITAKHYPSCQFLIIKAICLDGPLAQYLQPQGTACREVTYHWDWLVFSIQYRRSYIVLAREVQGWGGGSFLLPPPVPVQIKLIQPYAGKELRNLFSKIAVKHTMRRCFTGSQYLSIQWRHTLELDPSYP